MASRFGPEEMEHDRAAVDARPWQDPNEIKGESNQEAGWYVFGRGLHITNLYRMDALILQKATGLSISRLGRPRDQANTLSAIQIRAVSQPLQLNISNRPGNTSSRWAYAA